MRGRVPPALMPSDCNRSGSNEANGSKPSMGWMGCSAKSPAKDKVPVTSSSLRFVTILRKPGSKAGQSTGYAGPALDYQKTRQSATLIHRGPALVDAIGAEPPAP